MKRILPLLVVIAAAGLLVAGIALANGDISLVWQKARMICQECIGIG